MEFAFTLQPGWWLAPALVTLLVTGLFGWYWISLRIQTDGRPGIVGGLIWLLLMGVSVIIVLVAWLLWALLK